MPIPVTPRDRSSGSLAKMNIDLRLVADSVVPLGAEGVAVDGKLCSLPSDLPFVERRDRLADMLYKELYIRPGGRTGRAATLADVKDFQASLLGAIRTRRIWQPGWTVASTEPDGSSMVTRNGIAFHAPRGEVDPGGALPPDAPCTVRVPAAYLGSSPGFLVVIGKDDLPAGAPVSRFYWHLKAEAACTFLATATASINASRIPFKLKVVNNPDDYVRADAGVIYVARRDLPTVFAVVERVHAAVAHGLRPQTPLFTRRLAHGLGAADDPGNGLSFGQAVCRLVAEAILGLPAHQVDAVAARRAAVAATFEAHGLNCRRPHLAEARGRRDDYRPLQVPTGRHRRGLLQMGERGSFLGIAEEIGRSLCAQAIWSATGDRCNWLARANGTAGRNGLAQAALAPLRHDFYGGLAGVALFLAELFRQTGTDIFREAAVGGIRSACAQVIAAGEDNAQPGFHTGIAGLYHSARRVRAL
ncbi:MAG TPA: T3SS effector HopA1 family protein, partial [Gemmataceae bacterium]|nr:T3SS effector HopA1 family protein [Gemmataceae bacterium]